MLTFFQTLEGGMNLPHWAVSSLPPPTLTKGRLMYNIKIQRQFALTGMFMESINHPVIVNIHVKSVSPPSFWYQQNLDFWAYLTNGNTDYLSSDHFQATIFKKNWDLS